MKFIFETFAEAQQTTLAAAFSLADRYLIAAERFTRLHIEASRTAFEKSSEMASLCLEGNLLSGATSGWQAFVQSEIEKFSAHCRNIQGMA